MRWTDWSMFVPIVAGLDAPFNPGARRARSTLAAERPGVRVEVEVNYLDGKNHLPIVTLRRAA